MITDIKQSLCLLRSKCNILEDNEINYLAENYSSKFSKFINYCNQSKVILKDDNDDLLLFFTYKKDNIFIDDVGVKLLAVNNEEFSIDWLNVLREKDIIDREQYNTLVDNILTFTVKDFTDFYRVKIYCKNDLNISFDYYKKSGTVVP